MKTKVRALVSSALLLLTVPAWGCNQPDVVYHQPDPAELDDDEDVEPRKLTFDPDTVQTMHGTVTRVEPFQRMRGTRYGLRARLETDDGLYYVYLGPDPYMDRHGLRLSPGDELEVTGSVLDGDGPHVIIAQEVTQGSMTLELRDADGRPQWRG